MIGKKVDKAEFRELQHDAISKKEFENQVFQLGTLHHWLQKLVSLLIQKFKQSSQDIQETANARNQRKLKMLQQFQSVAMWIN